MNQNNLFVQFIIELFKRFATKSPKFFQVLQWVTAFLAAITGLPEVMHYWFSKSGQPMPTIFATFENKYIGLISIGAFVMASLTTASKPVMVTSDGVIKKTDEKLLPFTATTELKSAIKAGAPVTNTSSIQLANK